MPAVHLEEMQGLTALSNMLLHHLPATRDVRAMSKVRHVFSPHVLIPILVRSSCRLSLLDPVCRGLGAFATGALKPARSTTGLQLTTKEDLEVLMAMNAFPTKDTNLHSDFRDKFSQHSICIPCRNF